MDVEQGVLHALRTNAVYYDHTTLNFYLTIIKGWLMPMD